MTTVCSLSSSHVREIGRKALPLCHHMLNLGLPELKLSRLKTKQKHHFLECISSIQASIR